MQPILRRYLRHCIARFRAKLARYEVAPSGCWLWTGSIRDDGYGVTGIMGQPRLAHRLVYELERGDIPRGMVLDHLCRVRRCVNPDHLEVVTIAENTRRGTGAELARAHQLAKTHCKRGHPLSGDNIIIVGRQRVCLACRLIRKRAYNAKIPKKGRDLTGLALGGKANGARNLAKTHCPHGHPYDEANTYINLRTGARECRACHRVRASKRAVMRKEATPPSQ